MTARKKQAAAEKPERKKAGSTGGKGEAIVAYVAEHGPSKRADVAAAVGCVVGRVGEVCRDQQWIDHGEGKWGPAIASRARAAKKATATRR